jgi:hypothetical protein
MITSLKQYALMRNALGVNGIIVFYSDVLQRQKDSGYGRQSEVTIEREYNKSPNDSFPLFIGRKHVHGGEYDPTDRGKMPLVHGCPVDLSTVSF